MEKSSVIPDGGRMLPEGSSVQRGLCATFIVIGCQLFLCSHLLESRRKGKGNVFKQRKPRSGDDRNKLHSGCDVCAVSVERKAAWQSGW